MMLGTESRRAPSGLSAPSGLTANSLAHGADRRRRVRILLVFTLALGAAAVAWRAAAEVSQPAKKPTPAAVKAAADLVAHALASECRGTDERRALLEQALALDPQCAAARWWRARSEGYTAQSEPGSPVSLVQVLQHLDIQGLVGH